MVQLRSKSTGGQGPNAQTGAVIGTEHPNLIAPSANLVASLVVDLVPVQIPGVIEDPERHRRASHEQDDDGKSRGDHRPIESDQSTR